MHFKQKAFKKRRHNNNHNSTKQSRSQIDASKYERRGARNVAFRWLQGSLDPKFPELVHWEI